MTQSRERILFYTAVGVMGLGMAYMVYFKALIQPARKDREEAKTTASQVEELESELARREHYKGRLTKWAAASFGGNESQARERVRSHLIAMVGRAKLSPSELTLTPMTGKQVPKGAGKEIGWSVKTRGPLDRVIDLLFLIQNDPRLHRVEGINWMPVEKSTEVELSLRYITLVPEPLPGVGEKPPEYVADKPDATDPLADATRKQYALISERDLFRPYIKRPPPPPPPPGEAPTPPINRLTQLKVVGLPEWDGKAAVVVRDTAAEATRTYKVGEELIGGKIVLVDYRPLPRQDKPYLNSPSRVIVRIGREHWAVELGQTLAEKRKLAEAAVPAELLKEIEAKAPAPSPQPSTPDTKTATPSPPATQENPDAP